MIYYEQLLKYKCTNRTISFNLKNRGAEIPETRVFSRKKRGKKKKTSLTIRGENIIPIDCSACAYANERESLIYNPRPRVNASSRPHFFFFFSSTLAVSREIDRSEKSLDDIFLYTRLRFYIIFLVILPGSLSIVKVHRRDLIKIQVI